MVMVSEVDNLSIYNKLVEEYNPQIAIIKVKENLIGKK